jgi:hypothetical protein
LAFQGIPLKVKVVKNKRMEWNIEEEMKKGSSREER